MRTLVNTFSELFTGTQIHSASLDHWENVGNQAFQNKSGGGAGKNKDPSLADDEISKNTQSGRQRLFMRYSPLVERYLITHNYETINNVKKWRMLLTQRTEIQKDVDKKFKKFRQIAEMAVKTKDTLNEEYKKKCREANLKHLKNKMDAEETYKCLREGKKELKDTGSCPEHANLLTSIHISKHQQAGQE